MNPFKKALQDQGITYAQAAHLLGTGVTCVFRWCSDGVPRFDTMCKIKDLFGVNYEAWEAVVKNGERGNRPATEQQKNTQGLKISYIDYVAGYGMPLGHASGPNRMQNAVGKVAKGLKS